MKCKLSEKCEFGNLCKDATRHDSLTVLGCSSFKTKKPMTEQEYIQTCNAEQLADVFFEYRYVNATPKQKLWMSASEECIKADIVEWLKQPHTEKG